MVAVRRKDDRNGGEGSGAGGLEAEDAPDGELKDVHSRVFCKGDMSVHKEKGLAKGIRVVEEQVSIQRI
jgi:hypothetical protein